MKSLQNYILEAKNDNLHEFIQYLNKTGKRGQLKSKYKKEDIYSGFLADVDIRRKKKATDIPFRKLKGYEYSRYINDREINKVENSDFADWYADETTHIIINNLIMNKNNCIYVERAIGIPKFSDKDSLYKSFKKRYNGHLGICWSYRKEYAVAYDTEDEDFVDIVILKGYVQPESVNWRETIVTCLYYDEEYELRLLEGSPVQLTEIVTGEGQHKIFDKNLILKA